MRTITMTIYSFEELDERAQEKAIDNLRDINLDYEWREYLYYDASLIGVTIESFDTNPIHATGKVADEVETAFKIVDQHGEETETYKLAESFLREREQVISSALRDENGDLEDEIELDEKLDELDDEFRKDILFSYASMLNKEYEWRISDEQVKETILANGYEFTEDGEIAR